MAKTDVSIRRLQSRDGPLIVGLFERVYGQSYANEWFYDSAVLASQMQAQALFPVGAFVDDMLVGHMAMTVTSASAVSAELGNTVVDPSVRGAGIAWQVGDELNRWCKERGYNGFLHYPTTDHHIMQQQSVKAGFETGLMLGYIPADTDGQVHSNHDRASSRLRQAATVVYQPFASPARAASVSLYCPSHLTPLLQELVAPTGLKRTWQPSSQVPNGPSKVSSIVHLQRRGLQRFTVTQSSKGIDPDLDAYLLETATAPCVQLDVVMDNPNIDGVVATAQAAGFKFCAWLPGYRETDVLRLQKVAVSETQMQPGLVNPVAQRLLGLIA